MAYIQVTSNTSAVIFDLGVYAPVLGFSKFFRLKSTINTIALNPDWITYRTSDGSEFAIVHAPVAGEPNLLVVESVNGVTTTSLDDLFNKLLSILD